MSDKEKEIVQKLRDAIPQMSDFDKGYILGKVERAAEDSNKKKDNHNMKGSENYDENN